MAGRSSAVFYIVPFVLYLLGTTIAAEFADWYPLAYAGVVLLVGGITWQSLWRSPLIVPHRQVLDALLVGTLGIVLWIGLSELRLEDQIAEWLPSWLRPAPRVGYNPWAELKHPSWVRAFLAVRFLGLAALVPVIEELFWRGFLLRWLTSPEWEKLPPGQFSRSAFGWVVVLFALAHPEWLAAAIYCALLNGFFAWKKDLWKCIVAHAVSNLLLGLYVLKTASWWLW